MFLSIHAGHSGAVDIAEGNYEKGERITRTAVEFAKSASFWPSGRLELRNNLCVAQIMRGDHKNARKTCDRAVAQAKNLRPKYRQTRYKLRFVRATAFSNRGVLRVLDSDSEGARADFNAALHLRPNLDSVNQNLNVVDRIGDRSLAQVNVMTVRAR
jgi:Flp pilus assembly protein TadD